MLTKPLHVFQWPGIPNPSPTPLLRSMLSRFSYTTKAGTWHSFDNCLFKLKARKLVMVGQHLWGQFGWPPARCMWKAVWEGEIGIYHFLPSAISIRKAERVLPHLLWAQPQAQGRASAGIPTLSWERVRSTDLAGKTPRSQRHVLLPGWLNSDLSVSRELLIRQSDLKILEDRTCRRAILSSHQQLYIR